MVFKKGQFIKIYYKDFYRIYKILDISKHPNDSPYLKIVYKSSSRDPYSVGHKGHWTVYGVSYQILKNKDELMVEFI